MKIPFDRILFTICLVLALFAVSFTYGYLSHKHRIFPHQLISNAILAARAIYEVKTVEDRDVLGIDFPDPEFTKPAVNRFSKTAGREKILVLSNEYAHRALSETGCSAWIMDRAGNILHAWKGLDDIWSPLENRAALSDDWRAYPVYAHLYPNGDLLVSYQGGNVFPISMGLAKFDKDSNLLWKNSGYFHHAFDLDRQGRIYIPTYKIVHSPLKVPDRRKFFRCNKKVFTYDVVSILDPDGKLIEEIDLFDALAASDVAGLFHNSGQNLTEILTCDPMHLNDVRVMQKAGRFQSTPVAPGDLLLSFRSMNAIALFDMGTRRFTWFHAGTFDSQHSPRLVGDDRIFVFDNLGGRISRGTSRIAAIRLKDGGWETIFPKLGNPNPHRHFSSLTGGQIDIHPGQRRMLAAWTHKGLVWEIDIQSGRVLVNTKDMKKVNVVACAAPKGPFHLIKK